MHQEYIAVVELGEEIFGAPVEMLDRAAGQVFGEAARERHAEIGAAGLDRDEARMFHRRREAAADGFDLGKFGHSGFTMEPGGAGRP
jgi:hypothetical protein